SAQTSISSAFTPGAFSCFLVSAPPTPGLYTLSLHDALPICPGRGPAGPLEAHRIRGSAHPEDRGSAAGTPGGRDAHGLAARRSRSEEHTSALQSREKLVCRLLLEKKKNANTPLWSEYASCTA